MNYTKGEWKATVYVGETCIEATRNGRKCWITQKLYDEENEPHWEEVEANAHLIAASPKIYEALKEILTRLVNPADVEIASQALAKAEGKEGGS